MRYFGGKQLFKEALFFEGRGCIPPSPQMRTWAHITFHPANFKKFINSSYFRTSRVYLLIHSVLKMSFIFQLPQITLKAILAKFRCIQSIKCRLIYHDLLNKCAKFGTQKQLSSSLVPASSEKLSLITAITSFTSTFYTNFTWGQLHVTLSKK